MLNFKKTMIAAFVASSVFSLSGCLDSDDNDSSPAPVAQTPDDSSSTDEKVRTIPVSTAQHSIASGAFTEDMITDGKLNNAAWTYGWTVNVHGNATNWTKPATAGTTCPAETKTLEAATEADDFEYTDNFYEDLEGVNVCVLDPVIDANTTLTSDNVYLINNANTFVGDGNLETGPSGSKNATLTIEAGTLILGGLADALVVTRGSQIDAEGTAEKPIVFRSQRWAKSGTEIRGSWGGLVLQGKAFDFKGENVQGEGGVEYYAGADNTDSSGTLKYVVITGAGYDIDGNGNELNALTLQGVGSGTTLSYIQVDETLDDGIEFFGGRANIDHIVMSDIGDDGFDIDNGWQGTANYGLVYMSNRFTAGGPGESRGVEADGYDPKDSSGNKYLNGDENKTTIATLNNFTIIGTDEADSGMVLRRAVKIDADNINISGFTEDSCMEIRDRGTIEDHTVTDTATGTTTWSGSYTRLDFDNTVCYGNGGGAKLSMEKDETQHAANILSDEAADAALEAWKAEGGVGITFVAE